jgi:hypothetical protein
MKLCMTIESGPEWMETSSWAGYDVLLIQWVVTLFLSGSGPAWSGSWSLPGPNAVPYNNTVPTWSLLYNIACAKLILACTWSISGPGPYLVHIWSWFLPGPYLVCVCVSQPGRYLVPTWSYLVLVSTWSYLVLVPTWSISGPGPYLVHTWSIPDPYLVPTWSISDPDLVHF